MRPSKTQVLAAVLAIGLNGCAGITGGRQGAAPGMAAYELERSPDGACRVRITSGREVLAGTLTIGDGCTVSASADTLDGQDAQIKLLELVGRLLNRLP